MLYIVATPIGNLQDITLRALEVLKNADVIACEDTRHTRVLLDRYQIKKPLISYHSYSKADKSDHILDLLRRGKDVALVSDSGTPGISDPGAHLIAAAQDAGIPVTAAPGPAALVVGLILSGLPTDKFAFEGFLPVKTGARQRRLRELLGLGRTIIVYESPHRLVRLLEQIAQIEPGRVIACARELTKKFEEIKRGKACDLLAYFRTQRPRGEFMVIF